MSLSKGLYTYFTDFRAYLRIYLRVEGANIALSKHLNSDLDEFSVNIIFIGPLFYYGLRKPFPKAIR